MIKLKWFFLVSLAICSCTTGILYWHYQVLEKSLQQVEILHDRAFITHQTLLDRQLKDQFYSRMDVYEELGRKDEGDIEKVVLNQLWSESDHMEKVIMTTFDLLEGAHPYQEKQHKTFTVLQNNAFFMDNNDSIANPEVIYEHYQHYQNQLMKIVNAYVGTTTISRFELAPLSKEKFISQFHHVPITLSRSALVALDYRISTDISKAFYHIFEAKIVAHSYPSPIQL